MRSRARVRKATEGLDGAVDGRPHTTRPDLLKGGRVSIFLMDWPADDQPPLD